MSDSLISVIVPVYNSEQTLNRCIDSILGQTYRNFELLLINDGSKDRSGEICDEYARKDSRVKVLHKENGGVSSARNVGMDNARGEWFSFVDSDDWVEGDILESMYKTALLSGCSLVTCDFIEIKNRGVRYCNSFDWTGESGVDVNTLCKKELLEVVLSLSYGVVWNLLIDRKLIESLSFDVNLKYGEDNLFLFKLHMRTNKHFHLRRYLYHYDRTNEKSLTNNKTLDYHINNLTVSCELLSLLSKLDSIPDFMYRRVINCCYELVITPNCYSNIRDALMSLPSNYLRKCSDVSLKRKIVLWLILKGHTKILSYYIAHSKYRIRAQAGDNKGY